MSRPVHSMAVLLFVLTLSPLVAQAQSYRILLTNDDGYGTPELERLKEALERLPDTEVVVSAPSGNRSGASHSVSGEEMTVETVRRDGDVYAYSVSGTPADAVRYAVLTMGRDAPFDLVVSGINQGANVGDVAHLSGTVGAAMEGQYQGLPSIAVSQAPDGVDTARSAAFAARFVDRLRREGVRPASCYP